MTSCLKLVYDSSVQIKSNFRTYRTLTSYVRSPKIHDVLREVVHGSVETRFNQCERAVSVVVERDFEVVGRL
jgi:hypothetical protein